MPGHVRVTAVHLRIEVTGLDHRHLGIVGYQQLGNAADEGEGSLVTRDPVRKLLGPRRQRKRQARSAHHGDEDVGTADFSGPPVHHDRHRIASVIKEKLLAAGMALADDQRQAAFPAAEQIAESRVTIPVRMLGPILLPEHMQRHVFPLQFARYHRPVRLGQLTPPRFGAGNPVQPLFQIRVANLGWKRPR
jgi:hypothetical protein